MEFINDEDCEDPGPSRHRTRQCRQPQVGTRIPGENLGTNNGHNKNQGNNGARWRPRRNHSMHPFSRDNLYQSNFNIDTYGMPRNPHQGNRNNKCFQRNQTQSSGHLNESFYNRNNNENRNTVREMRKPRSISHVDFSNADEDEVSGKQIRYKGKYIGFNFLKEVSHKDSKQVITLINEKKDAFIHLLQSPIDKPDLYVVIMKISATVCNSSFEQLKSNFLLDICNAKFITNLRNYLMDLPDTNPSQNSMYWKNQTEFWENFITFCDYIIRTFPSIVIKRCRSLIQDASKCCLDGLNKIHGFSLTQEQSSKLEQLRESLTVGEEESTTTQPKKVFRHVDAEPPEDFRSLSILPTQEELLDKCPYLRQNIINGAYKNIEHYLDVQFRLLREDCFGPLRDGIQQFKEDPNRKKMDNIRVYRNVKFIQPYVSKQKVGSLVQVDEKTKKLFKKIKWAYSKRFIFGSLLLFSKDNCKSFITATILDRDIKLLTEGKIPISLVTNTLLDHELYSNCENFIMIESEVYFEPYFHVLKALQDPTFPQHIAMSKYIVDVNPEPQHPSYLNENSVYVVETADSSQFKFIVLDENSWPTSTDMGLNESQYEAYRLALTHELAVIQGPPGTGKTFLGVKVAKTLLENININNRQTCRPSSSCLLLLICYTNHALDQFLEAIIPVTNSIARIGGQSRSEAMEMFNLKYIRSNGPRLDKHTNKLYFEQKSKLKQAILELQRAQEQIETLRNGVLSYNCVQRHIPDSRIIEIFYKGRGDPLMNWLFEDMPIYFDYSLFTAIDEMPDDAGYDDTYERHEVIFDDFDDDFDVEVASNSFSVRNAEIRIQKLLTAYNDRHIHHEEKEKIHKEMTILSSHIKFFKEMSLLREKGLKAPDQFQNPARYSTEDRWRIYFAWADIVMNDVKNELKQLQDKVQEENIAYEEARIITDLEVLKDIKVIGMTTSGAARLRKLVQALAPVIVIVEEAAEVLEQHIVTSLTKHCKHLILIGDHQQLRPSAAYLKLAKEYNLEVSLFERMIANKMHSRRLNVQHRMRPEIAALISPHIYPDLVNHHSVDNFPRVLGMCNNLFFFTHDYQEEKEDDTTSKANHKEADMVMGLANYLMQQGYEHSDVTILTAYSGQMFYMRKQRERYAHLAKIKITVVDNYQGEESRIILLSLVRNNTEGTVGFLKIENRICVALSRAKEGFYIFGNIGILKNNSNLWVKIAETLEKNESLGTSLSLRCEVHSSQITTISSPKHFEKVPEGGCLLKCNYNLLNCNHQCPLICHGYDREHKNIKCSLKCERICERNLHVCPRKCWENCGPCQQPLRRELPCGHARDVPCWLEPSDPSVLCDVKVDVTLPHCGHETFKPCSLDVKYVNCPIHCDARLPCGHVCVLKCHVRNDPDHNNYVCKKSCAKAKKGCSLDLEGDRGLHQCRNKCFEACEDCDVQILKKRSNCKHSDRVACNENVDEKPCRKNCARTLPCGHFCKKKCHEKCGDCRQQVKKKIPDCGHEVTVKCYLEATREMCKEMCERKLECGHMCGARCAAPCDRGKCQQPIPTTFDSPCGHKVCLPCHAYSSVLTESMKKELLLKYCKEPCNAQLACSHVCGGSCGGCRQGRLHAPCLQTCNQTIICGHQCMEPCNQICPPCTKPCEVKCQHSKCKKLCGEPCVPCKEKCSRQCAHGACGRFCGEACARPPCDQQCPRALRCGHPCRGLCGEPCPPICAICRPDDFPKDFLGDDFADDDKFVLLEDCKHVLDLENMDNRMFGDKDTVSIRSCPFCRKPIINTHRYKDFVNNMFKKEINPIKERVYGTKSQIQQKKKELLTKLDVLIENPPKIASDKVWLIQKWRIAFDELITKVNRKNNVSLLQVEMHYIYLNILEMLSETYDLYIAAKLVTYKEIVVHQIEIICKTLKQNIQKISQQQQKDIGNEIKRLNSIIQLAKIVSHPSYVTSQEVPKVKEVFEKAKATVMCWSVYEENKGVKALKLLQEEIKVSGIATMQERKLIVKAIGLKAGHWYKCPNGHFYCIGECGGAMQVSKCIECGVKIGGEHHSLLSSNRHAPEMDGSQFPAWSEEYNNMRNFNFE